MSCLLFHDPELINRRRWFSFFCLSYIPCLQSFYVCLSLLLRIAPLSFLACLTIRSIQQRCPLHFCFNRDSDPSTTIVPSLFLLPHRSKPSLYPSLSITAHQPVSTNICLRNQDRHSADGPEETRAATKRRTQAQRMTALLV